MTARSTIESTLSRYLRLPEEADDCADEVVMALERAGYAVVSREPSRAQVDAAIDRPAAEAISDGLYVSVYRAMVKAAST